MEISAQELIEEFQRRYPKEFEIAALAVSNQKLSARVIELEETTELAKAYAENAIERPAEPSE